MQRFSKLFSFLIMVTLVISCSDDGDDMTQMPDPMPDPEPATPMVKLEQNNTIGSYLTDENGMTLYFFTKDAFIESECTSSCLDNWPVYNIENLTVEGALNTSDFASITRSDGATQTTYKGWPLYYFTNDNVAGDINGDGVNEIWFAAKPDYTIMLVDNQLIGADGVNYKSDYTPGEEETQYFVDALGRTLYAFIFDSFETNNYTKEDFSNDANWPLFMETAQSFPSNLDPSLFKSIDVFGQSQLTYKGWPLYYFGADDMVRGSNKGVSVPNPGVWPIVSKDIAEAEVECNTENVSYSESIEPVMTGSCAFSGCHAGANPAAGLLLTDFEVVKTIADNGRLMGVINWESGFSPMPKDQDQLDQCTIDIIKSWVDAGAMNN